MAGRGAGRTGAQVPTRSGRAAAKRRGATAAPTVLEVDGLPVRLARKRIKNVNLRVKTDGQVEVSAPLHAADAFVASFVREKRPWIEAKRAEMAASPRAEAAAASPEEVAAWEPIMGVRAGRLAYRNMTSRWGSCQPATGRICINVRLALYPPECLEYVVVHELCHLRERGHGQRFKDLMDTYMPDWRERRAKLR